MKMTYVRFPRALRILLPLLAVALGSSTLPQSGGELWAQDRAVEANASEARKLRILCFGAHPDDCEIQAGGVAAMWSAQGHAVKFVSVTNGDIGHWREAGGPLARRRKAEVTQAARILRIETEVLDIHDGELLPTLDNRRTIVRLIRRWNADVVMSHRPNDYHPDHRAVGMLLQDAAFMVTVPFFCPDVAALESNPVFLFYPDRFQKPYPFDADIAVDVGAVMQQKLDALAVIESQFYEGGALGSADLLSDDPVEQQRRRQTVRERFSTRNRNIAEQSRNALAKWYGADAAIQVEFAEAFEVCEYGRQPGDAEIARLFPFFPTSQ